MLERPASKKLVFAICTAAVYSFGCGGAPPPPPSPPQATVPTPQHQPVIASAELSEAPEPGYVVALLRWKSPQATLETIYRWTGLPLTSSQIASELVDKSLAESLALDAPVDAVVALDPKASESDFVPLAAVSVGVQSLEQARRAAQSLGTVTEVRPGEYKISMRHGKRRGEKPVCLLRSAVGPAPARLICGPRERDLSALSSFMTRTLPKRELGTADLHLEVRAAPAVQLYGPMMKTGLRMGAVYLQHSLEIGEPAFDRALTAATSGVSGELLAIASDADTFTFDLAMSPERAGAEATLRFKGQDSWVSSTLANEASRAAAPPAMFWRLPASATMAGFQFNADPHRYDGIRRSLGDMLDGWLAHEGIGSADRAFLTALFSEKFVSDSPWVSASGPFPPPEKPAAMHPASDPLQNAIDEAGWYLVGIAAPNQTGEVMKTLATGLNRPKLQSLLRSKLASLEMNDGTKPAVKTNGPVMTLKSVAPPKELGKNGLDFEVSLARDVIDSKKAGTERTTSKTPLKMHILVMPEPSQTWIALGSDRRALAKIVLFSAESGASSDTLASRGDLGQLKSGRFAGASFFTLESLLHSWFGVLTTASGDADATRTMQELRNTLATTPNKGKAPLFLTAEITRGDELSTTTRVEVPKGYIEDVIMMVASSTLAKIAHP